MPIEQRVMNAPQRPGGIKASGGIKPKAEAAVPDDEPKKSKKKLVVILAVVVVLLAAAAYYFFFMPSGGAAEAEEPAPEPGKVFTVEAMSINLADGHYLRLGLGLQLTADAHELDAAKARDAAIVLFSGKSVAEVSDPASRDALKGELAHQLDELYEGEVMGVYLTDFVTQ